QLIRADRHQLITNIQTGGGDAVDAARADQNTQMVGQVLQQAFEKIDDLLVLACQVIVIQHQHTKIFDLLLDRIDQLSSNAGRIRRGTGRVQVLLQGFAEAGELLLEGGHNVQGKLHQIAILRPYAIPADVSIYISGKIHQQRGFAV